MQECILVIFHLSCVWISLIIQLCILTFVLLVSLQSTVDQILAVTVLVEICNFIIA